MKIYNGYNRLNENYSILSDAYEHTMGEGYLLSNKANQIAVFDAFFRITDFLKIIQQRKNKTMQITFEVSVWKFRV